MLSQIITQYLAEHKRLIIPGLGALLVKPEQGTVLFSELLQRDDGILCGLLIADGMSELAARGAVDRLVFEVRHATGHGEEYRLEGLGVFRAGANSTINFTCDPQIIPPPVEEQLEKPAPPTEEPVEEAPLRPNVADVAPAVEDPVISPSVKLNPDPALRGLRYGKPPKNTNTYTYVNRPVRRRGTDRFIWIALIAILIALGAIGFGMWHDHEEKQAEATELIENE